MCTPNVFPILQYLGLYNNLTEIKYLDIYK